MRLSHVVPTGHLGYPSLFKNFADEIIQPLADYGGGSPCGSLYLQEPGCPRRTAMPFTPASGAARWSSVTRSSPTAPASRPAGALHRHAAADRHGRRRPVADLYLVVAGSFIYLRGPQCRIRHPAHPKRQAAIPGPRREIRTRRPACLVLGSTSRSSAWRRSARYCDVAKATFSCRLWRGSPGPAGPCATGRGDLHFGALARA